MDLNIRIAGEAGQGVQTTGSLLVGALAGLGLHVYSTQSYMSRIRGGLNWFDVRIADTELHSPTEKTDVLVALTDKALAVLGPQVAPGGVVMYDAKEAQSPVVAIDFTGLAKEVSGSSVMANTVAAGAVFNLLGYDVKTLCEYLRREFHKKGDEVVDQNIRCARRGAEMAGPNGGGIKAPSPAGAPANVISGAEAIGLSAAAGGVKFVSAYPMSPSTPTLNVLAELADRYGIVVEQAEDEIAAVNMICGATYAGVPAMATTSGGGFALMVEALALAGMMELPIFIVLGQRPGPATGLPTRTAQQDLGFALHAGHGEFVRAIFSPGTLQQCYTLTRRAMETAHKFQTPVILMTDQFLQDLQKNIEPLDATYRPIDRCIVDNNRGDYVRYAITDSGVSPRALPGGEAAVICDSDEHSIAGKITEDLIGHLAQQDKRMRKLVSLTAEAQPAEFYGPQDAQTLLVCWGSTYGPCRTAVDSLNTSGPSAATLHFSQVWPIRADEVRQSLKMAKRVVCVEGNSTGQFASLLRGQGAMGECGLILRYDGLPFTAEYILERLEPVS